jgi:hypothetical protein
MSNWRHDITAFDKKKKGIHYFFQSKNQFEKNGNGKWIRCSNESTCLKMAEKGYIVKKAVERGHESQS